MIGQGLNHHREGQCFPAFVQQGICPVYQSSEESLLMKALSCQTI